MQPTHNPPTTTPAKPPVATILYGAAGYLRRHGWRQCFRFDLDSGDQYPPACAAGAIDATVTGDTRLTLTQDQTRQAHAAMWWLATTIHDTDLADCPGADCTDEEATWHIVTTWNDRQGQTAADVIAVLEQAANSWDMIHGGPCRSDFCVASFCDGIHHVDATGYTWIDDIRPTTGSADPS